jgi:hypothetical protein
MSRHRGAKRSRRYELSKTISLLSPAYLLFVERQPFHTVLPDHYDRQKIPARRVCLTVKQTIPLRAKINFYSCYAFVRLRYLLEGDRPSQTTRS